MQASIEGGSDQTLLVDTGSSGLVIPSTDLSPDTTVRSRDSHWNQRERLQRWGRLHLSRIRRRNSRLRQWRPRHHEYPHRCGDPVLAHILQLRLTVGFPAISCGQRCQPAFWVSGTMTAVRPTSPLEADGYDGVLVDIPNNTQGSDLIVEPTAPTGGDTVSGAPISSLYETVTTNGSTTGSTVSDDVDSGGVYGTIPSSLDSSVAPGSARLRSTAARAARSCTPTRWAAPARSRRRRRGPRSTAASNRT